MLGAVNSFFALWMSLAVASAGTLSPAELQSRIHSQGGHKVLWALWDNQAEWNQLFSGVASGNPDWLKIAQALHPFSDGAASEDIHNAVAQALPKAPERTLSMIGPGFEIDTVCTSPFLEPKPGVAEAYEQAALKALATVRDPKLRDLASACATRVKLPGPKA